MTATDFASTMGVWLERSLLAGRVLVPLALVAALALEYSRGSSRRGWWRAIGVRTAVAVVLLAGRDGRSVYGGLLGWSLETALGIDLLGQASWVQLGELARGLWAAQRDARLSPLALEPDGTGAEVLRSMVAATPLVLQACLMGLTTFARLLASGLHLVGPSLLALAIVDGGRLVARWARLLLAVAAFPGLLALALDLADGVALGSSPDVVFQALGLGVLLGGLGLTVPLLSWAGAGMAIKGIMAVLRAAAALGAAHRQRAKSAARLRRQVRQQRPEASPKRVDRISWETDWPSESGPLLREPLRATPALPRAGVSVERFGERPPEYRPAVDLRPPPIPPVTPSEVQHGVGRGQAGGLDSPTPKEGIRAARGTPAYPRRRPPVSRRARGRAEEAELTRKTVPVMVAAPASSAGREP